MAKLALIYGMRLLPEEDLGHGIVVVLSGVHEPLRHVECGECVNDRSGLGKVRPCAGHVHDER